MSAVGLPEVKVLLDDTSNDGTWPYDVTSYVRMVDGVQITRGRADELSTSDPGQLQLTLDNSDGRFSLGSTLGGYGAINVDRRIKAQVKPTGASTWVDRFLGWVQAWPTTWPDGTDRYAATQIVAMDAMTRWQRRTLRSVIEEEYLLDGPVAYWTLGDAEGSTTCAESSGHSAPVLTFSAPGVAIFGSATGPGTDGLTAAHMTHAGDLRCVMPDDFYSFECVALRNGAPSGEEYLIVVDHLFAGWEASTGNLFVDYTDENGLMPRIVTSTSYSDNLNHHIRVELDGLGNVRLYVDGVLAASATDALVDGTAGTNVAFGFFTGTLSHIALWGPGAMSPTRVADHSAACSTGFAGDTAASRVQRLLNYEGSSTTMGAATATTAVAFGDFTGSTVTDAIQQIVDAEGGRLWIDGSGIVQFLGRDAIANAAPYVLDAATDVVADLQVQADTQQLCNYATAATNADGAPKQLWRDLTSEAEHGRYAIDDTYLVTSDAEALARAQWSVANYSEPKLRVPSLTFDLLTADATPQLDLSHEVAVGFRVTINNLPAQAGSSASLVVEGLTETLSVSEWTMQVNASSASLYDAWTLDDATASVLDSTTRLYY